MDEDELLWDDGSGFADSKTDLTEHEVPLAGHEVTSNGFHKDGHVPGLEEAERFTIYEPCVMDTKTQKASWKKKVRL